MRAVIDTGVLVSALIRRQGTTGDVLHALRDGRFTAIYSTDILAEIIDVLGRPNFRHSAKLVRIATLKFREVALTGSVNCIVSGDTGLLDLTPFENITILHPAEFLARF
jgi:predicted nucleic acid-binding protein